MESIIGLIAATCTTFALVPQVAQVVRTRMTRDISFGYMAILWVGMALWLTYGIMILDMPLILANIVSILMVSVILGYKFRFG